MALHFLQLIRARFFNTAADTAIDVGVKNETNARLAIDAGGKLQWGDGTLSADTNLYRSAANTLKTDDGFVANTITSGGEVITASAAGNLPLRIRGAASQSANLQEWQNSSNTVLSKVTSAGNFVVTSGGTDRKFISEFTAGSNTQFVSLWSGSSLALFQFANSFKFGIQAAANQADTGGSNYSMMTFGSSRNTVFGDMAFNQADPAYRLTILGSDNKQQLVVRAFSTQTANIQEWQLSNSTVVASISSNGSFSTTGSVTVGGNLTVNGTTFTVNSTTVTIDDPIFTLGGDTAPTIDDNKDRGIEFRWHDGTSAKVGFFGLDDSTGKFIFIPDATNTSEVFSGTKGTIDANLEWADVLNKPTLFNWDTPQTLSAKTSSYTLLTADVGTAVTFDSSTAVNCTIDGSLNLTPGQRIDVIQLGTGQVTFAASSATVNATPGLKMRSRYSAATIICVATDSYVVVGDLSA